MSFANHPTTGAFPTFNFSAGTGFTPIGRDKDGPGQSKTTQFTDNLSHIIGRHTIRAGIDVRRVFYETVVRWGESDDFGAFTFNQGVFTGSAFGDFLLGAPQTSFIVESSPNTNEPSVQWGIYAQDQWQVNDRLTVNFGLRWELLPEFTENQGDIANFDPTERRMSWCLTFCSIKRCRPVRYSRPTTMRSWSRSTPASYRPGIRLWLLKRPNREPGPSFAELAQHLLAQLRSASRHRFPSISRYQDGVPRRFWRLHTNAFGTIGLRFPRHPAGGTLHVHQSSQRRELRPCTHFRRRRLPTRPRNMVEPVSTTA